MSTAVATEARIQNIEVTDDTITARLLDGRVISVPLAWSWRLSEATPEQRQRYRIIGHGLGVHWPDVDEDISAEGMLHGFQHTGRTKRAPMNIRGRRVRRLTGRRSRRAARAVKSKHRSDLAPLADEQPVLRRLDWQ